MLKKLTEGYFIYLPVYVLLNVTNIIPYAINVYIIVSSAK